MKARFSAIISASLLVFVLSFVPITVLAQETENNTPTTTTQQTTSTDEEPLDPVKLKERLTKRKTDLKTRIDATKQARLKSRCKASQGNLSSIRGRIKGLETSRSNVYENLVNRLTKLNDKLKEKGVNTAELESQITQLNSLIETFNTDLAAYKEAVGDMAGMDCASDPTAFQASLDAARTARAKTAEDAKAIRSYLTDTIKPTLKVLKSQVEQKTEDTSGETE
ncbi:hypothetical protein H0X10_01290 [Candidatus Saccharibacteria bacterium]|nr:hypothetical protein [Candidatus Saccharibacteria bacterium]